MAYKVIPQVEFDKSVQKIQSVGLNKSAAESVVLSLWKACIDTNSNFKSVIEKAVASGQLDVSENILEQINLTLPATIRYHKETINKISPIAFREL